MFVSAKFLRVVFVALGFCQFGWTASATAAVSLFLQGLGPSSDQLASTPFSDSLQKVADNFPLSGVSFPNGASVTRVHWWGSYYQTTNTLQNPNGDFTIRFYDDGSGKPGILLDEFVVQVQGTATSVQAQNSTATGDTIFEFFFDVPTAQAVPLVSNTTYWLSVLGADINGNSDLVGRFRWALDGSGGLLVMVGDADWTTQNIPFNTAFELVGDPTVTSVVPEPASFSLLMLGLLAIAPAWRRREAAQG